MYLINWIEIITSLQSIKSIHGKIVDSADLMPKTPDGLPDIKHALFKGKLYEFDTFNWFEYKNFTDNDHKKFFTNQLI